MSSERWQQIDELFQAALESSGDQRAALLARACAGDEALRVEVESLIAFHEKANGPIDSPAFADGLQLLRAGEPDLPANLRIGPYKILQAIGRGGMGTVYLAMRDDDHYQKQVAIKLIKRGMDVDFVIQRFRSERQILANLEHPNVARLIDGGTTADGRPYLVLEYVEGQPIGEYCDAQQVSIETRLRLFLTVCAAVQFAHQNLVVHRDIKPGNILVTRDGVPKLLDFGIAKLIDPALSESGNQTATVLRVMTPEYASPEQVLGSPITTSCDVYSLGVLLYELLTGRRPYQFAGRTQAEIERVICTVEPEKPSKAIADFELRNAEPRANSKFEIRNSKFLRGDLDNIVLMAMRKEPERRYVSVAQFSEDIRRHLEGLPIVAHQDSLSYRAKKFITRHKIGAAAATLVALTVIAGAVGIVWQARIARQQARLATQERDRARLETAKAERINQFLQDTLGFADQGWFSATNGKGPNATIGEALDQASQRAETELADQPEVLADVLFTIGAAQFNRAKFDLAEQYLRKCWVLRRKSYGDDSPKTAQAMLSVAAVLTLKGDYNGAEPLFEQGLATYHKHFAEGSVPTLWLVETLGSMGLFKVVKGQPAAAEPLLREALSLSSRLTGTDRKVIAIAYSTLGQARVAQGDLAEGEKLYRSSIEEYRKLPGRERPEVATTLNYLGELLKTEGKYSESEVALREALEIGRRLSGESSPNVAVTSAYLAHLLYLKGNYAEAEKVVNQSLQIVKQVLPPGHIAATHPMTVLGLIMNKTGRSIKGEAILREALEIRERVLPKGSWQIAFTKGALGECLTTLKRYAEAEPLLRESYDDVKKSQGEQNSRTLEARLRLAQLYQASGNKKELAAFASR